MKCSRCGNHVVSGAEAERPELVELLGYVAGLLEDVHDGVPSGAEGVARVCVETTLRQVRRVPGVLIRRVWGPKS